MILVLLALLIANDGMLNLYNSFFEAGSAFFFANKPLKYYQIKLWASYIKSQKKI